MRKAGLISLILLANSFGEWPTQWSRNLPRPVLFVHGINANMVSWGAQAGGNYCVNPSAVFLGPIRAYVPEQPAFTTKPIYTPPSGPTAPSGPWMPYTVLPTTGKYFLFPSSGTTTGPLAKESGTPDWALPPTFGSTDKFMQVVTGSKYRITCADGSTHDDQVQGWNGQFDAVISKNGFFDGKAMMQIKWNNLLYSTWPNAWREGLVYTYKPGSGARAVAQYFAVDMSNQSILDPNYGINHNGMEFYNSLYPSQDVLDPFARIDLTDGSVSNPILNKMEIGQTGQLYEKVTKVLDEYYSDWRTNPDRKIDIVAHSQGGLVTRSMIFKKDSPGLDNPANHINSIITLDTPHLGTAIATDASGVPLISDIRNLVYGLKGNLNISGNVKGDTYLGPYHLHAPGIDITINPFGDAVNMLQNFTATDQYLAYPSNYSNPNWSPAQSVMASGQATSGRSEFVTNLKDLGKFPTNHYSGRKIPLTAYFGTTPHLAPELGEKAIAAAYDMCDGTPDNLSYGVFRTAYVVSKAADIVLWIVTGQSNLVTVDIPACWEIVGNELAPFVRRKAIELDDSWGKYSDFVVDEASQKGLGLFSEKSDPFLAIPLAKVNASDPGVPHMDFGHYYDDGTDLKGATAHGLEIAKALDRPPREKLPPSIISLLLN